MKSERRFSLVEFAHEMALRLSARQSDRSLGCTELATNSGSGKLSITGRVRSWSGFGDEGQALVELALVSSILLVTITGILIFGIFEMQIMALTQGVDNAGLALAVKSGRTLDPCADAVQAVQGGAPLLSSSNLSYQIVLNPTPILGSASNVAYSGTSCSSTSTTTGAAGNLSSGGTVTVTATYNKCSLQFFGNNLMPNGCQISQSITETVQ
jgi:Flp pilus assembly protein TadG